MYPRYICIALLYCLLQESQSETGEIGGPKGAYQGAEPTRFGEEFFQCIMYQVHFKVQAPRRHIRAEQEAHAHIAGDWERGGRCTDF